MVWKVGLEMTGDARRELEEEKCEVGESKLIPTMSDHPKRQRIKAGAESENVGDN